MSMTRSSLYGKEILFIENHSTALSVEQLKKLIDTKLVLPEHFSTAYVDYNCSKGIYLGPGYQKDSRFYPLRFVADKKSGDTTDEIWVSSVTAGYGGEGPHGTLKCLEMMDFHLSEEEIDTLFSLKDAHLVYIK